MRLKRNMVTNIIGLRWYNVAIGLSIPSRSCWSSSCVRFHRRPDITAAMSTSKNPSISNFVSPSTVKITPVTINPMIMTSRTRGFSNPNMNENSSTQIGVLDLTIV